MENLFFQNDVAPMKEPYNLREKSEAPLKEIDSILLNYAKFTNAKVLFNYRDYPSRTIYWRKGRRINFIQIRLNADDSIYDNNIMSYDIFACSYKILFPILTFWNMRFDTGSNKCRKVGMIVSPINPEMLSSLLDTSFDFLAKRTFKLGTVLK
jgi:hypothetical protein